MPPVTVPLDVQPDALDAAAAALARIAGEVRDAGTRLEHATLSPPRVGDLPATAVFDQAHYDWTQTRFEDLTASADGLDHLGGTLHAAAARYRDRDDVGANGLVISASTAGQD